MTRAETFGLENVPDRGPALIVTNHLGDTDVAMGLAFLPLPETMAKAELYDFPILGKVMEAYGVIWVHRGRPDRRALRAALQALKEGRMVALAPEGRQSLTGSLEEGTGGAAFLALRANVPILPVTFVGTENENVYGSLKRFRRGEVSMTVGAMFRLDPNPDRKEVLRQGTHKIMQTLAQQLPPAYRGIYGS
ncbi:MAG: lysophospholipid acyltransferase family protein [Anaerolineales bacterium]